MITTLIILNYNDAVRTADLVKKVSGYSSLDHIVVVDNGSTDDSAEVLSGLSGGHIHFISRDTNGGYAKGNNTGILFALNKLKSDIIFIANPDVYFTDETAAAMASALSEHSEYGSIAPLVSKGYNVWHLPGFFGILVSLFLFAFTFEKIAVRKKIENSGSDIVPVGVVEGSFFAVRADAIRKAHGFDERTFLYAEEIILSFRLKSRGYLTGVLPSERYDHLHSASIRKMYRSSKAAAFHHFRQSFGIYNKYYLKTGPLRDLIFDICWKLGFFERKLYDLITSRKIRVSIPLSDKE